MYASSASAFASELISFTAAAPPKLAMKCLRSIWIIGILLSGVSLTAPRRPVAGTSPAFHKVADLLRAHSPGRHDWLDREPHSAQTASGFCWSQVVRPQNLRSPFS